VARMSPRALRPGGDMRGCPRMSRRHRGAHPGYGEWGVDAQLAGEFGPDALAIRHALQFSPEVVRRETASGRWNDATVTTYLRRWAREAPDGIAATAPGYPPLTFAQALEKSERFAAALAARGIRRGDVIMVQLPSSPD